MALEIVPFKRVGDLIFGMKRKKVREILGSDFTTFKKTQWSTNTTDNYSVFGLHLYYTEYNELEFVEMFPPAKPIFMGMNLLQEDVKNTLEILRRVDPEPKTDGASYIFYTIGISVYIEGDKLEAISVFPKGYYDNLLEMLENSI